MGRGETRGSDSENMRREKVRELIVRERERECAKKKFVSHGYRSYKIR